jgi:hypothetical protein
MVLIAKNEIEFFNFLKDDYKTGAFNLNLKEIQNEKNTNKREKKTNKRKMLIYKKQNKPGTVTLYEKKNGKMIGVYMKETNTLMAENVDRFISRRIRFLENKNLFEASETRSPRVNEVVTPASVQEEIISNVQEEKTSNVQEEVISNVQEAEIASVQEEKISNVQETENASVQEEKTIEKNVSEKPVVNHTNSIQDLLNTELKGAKKVWAILSSGEEIQVENCIFEESNIVYIGNSKTNVELNNVNAVKYRGKIFSLLFIILSWLTFKN